MIRCSTLNHNDDAQKYLSSTIIQNHHGNSPLLPSLPCISSALQKCPNSRSPLGRNAYYSQVKKRTRTSLSRHLALILCVPSSRRRALNFCNMPSISGLHDGPSIFEILRTKVLCNIAVNRLKR